jgi:hypothetical protein
MVLLEALVDVSQEEDNQSALRYINSDKIETITKVIISILRKRSLIDSTFLLPPVNLAISLPKVGVIPMSNKANQACIEAKKPIKPYDSIPRYLI